MNRKREFLGYIHRQASRIDGKPIAVVINGFGRGSQNVKTGKVLQSYIFPVEVSPRWAIKTGADYSVCHRCRHRPFLRGWDNGLTTSCPGDCYVNPKPLISVYKAFLADRYQPFDPTNLDLFKGRILRLGSWGEPPAIDLAFWRSIVDAKVLRGWLGYTHLWNHPIGKGFEKLCQASVDTIEEQRQAAAAGWFTFRVGYDVLPDELRCPASKEMQHRTTCSVCRVCDGTKSNRVIQPHGYRTCNGKGI